MILLGRLVPTWIVALAAALAGAALGAGAQQARIAGLKADNAETLATVAQATAKARQATVAALEKQAALGKLAQQLAQDADTRTRKELNDALEDNRRRFAGPEPVRVRYAQARCAATAGGDVPDSAPASVGAGAGEDITLTEAGRRVVSDLRAETITDAAALTALADWAAIVKQASENTE